MNADGTSKSIKFFVDSTTTWYKIRSFICNNSGDFYYLYYDKQVLQDNNFVMPLIQKIDDIPCKVVASTKRSEYTKRVKHY